MKHKIFSESWANAAPSQTILQSLQESEHITNIMMGRILQVIGIAYLMVWGLTEMGVAEIEEELAFLAGWGVFALNTAVFFLTEFQERHGKWIRYVVTADFLICSALVTILQSNAVAPYLLLLFLTTGYSDRQFTVILSAISTVQLTALSYVGSIAMWNYQYVNLNVFKFPEGATIHFSGWDILNLADYMTAEEYAIAYLQYEIPIELIALIIGGICCFMIADKNHRVLVRQHVRDEVQSQIAIELSRNKAALIESNSRLLVSQIQPHFIYNVLNTIYHLCELDSEMAQEAVSDFSDYLRTNLKTMETRAPIPFAQEREHIETYLRLEKMRFGDRLSICWDIETEDFKLPGLSLQPLIENAVKHGICAQGRGGTVTISTRETEKEYQIIVADDGVGFDISVQQDDTHVGIRNVRTRLEILCRATLEVQSIPGEGTTVTITIPKET